MWVATLALFTFHGPMSRAAAEASALDSRDFVPGWPFLTMLCKFAGANGYVSQQGTLKLVAVAFGFALDHRKMAPSQTAGSAQSTSRGKA